MKNIFCLQPILVCVLILVACAGTLQEHVDGMIQSGDEVDGVLFSPLDELLNWDQTLAFLCDNDPVSETDTSATLSCSTLPGSRIFFGNCGGILFSTPEEADEAWQEFEIEISFDGRAMDLDSFGYLETEFYPDPSQELRLWNLAVENVTPGTHTVECVEEEEGQPFTLTYRFEVTESQGSFPKISDGVTARIHPHTTEKGDANYLLYVPDAYGSDPQQKWPLLIILHGRSRVYSDVTALGDDYPLNTLAEDGAFPFVVVAVMASGLSACVTPIDSRRWFRSWATTAGLSPCQRTSVISRIFPSGLFMATRTLSSPLKLNRTSWTGWKLVAAMFDLPSSRALGTTLILPLSTIQICMIGF
jgi:hypothetical protein